MELHAELNIVSQQEIFRDILIKFEQNKALLIGPDKGSCLKINEISKMTQINGVVLYKQRSNHKEKAKIIVSKNEKGIIEKYNIYLIFDDEICSGDTIYKTIKKLISINPNCKIFIFTTHAFFSNKLDFLDYEQVMQMYITNSVSLNSKINNSKLIRKDISIKILDCINDD